MEVTPREAAWNAPCFSPLSLAVLVYEGVDVMLSGLRPPAPQTVT